MRFFTTPSVREARLSVGWSLFFIFLLYFTAPAYAAFAKLEVYQNVIGQSVADLPQWVAAWGRAGIDLVGACDAANAAEVFKMCVGVVGNGDGILQAAEFKINADAIVLATPEIAGLPYVVAGLVAAGGLAAALSTASGLLLVISSSVAHDLYYKRFRPQATEAERLRVGRYAMAGAVVVAGYVGINPPGFVAEVVALAFGLAAASFFPVIVLGIFWRRANAQGAISGLLVGLSTASLYMYFVLFQDMEPWFDVSAIGVGAVSMVLNTITMVVVSRLTPPPPAEMQALIEHIRHPWVDMAQARREVEEAAELEAPSP
jgi:cation/acetate symporter